MVGGVKESCEICSLITSDFSCSHSTLPFMHTHSRHNRWVYMCSIHNHLQLPMHIHLIFLLHIHRSLFLASYAILIFFTLISQYSHLYRSGCELRERVVCLRVGWILDTNFLSIFHYIKMQHHAMPARESTFDISVLLFFGMTMMSTTMTRETDMHGSKWDKIWNSKWLWWFSQSFWDVIRATSESVLILLNSSSEL